jgi:P-type Mg2+ transporter
LKGKTYTLNQEIKQQILKRVNVLSRQGFRVLAVAYKITSKQNDYTPNDEQNLVFSGLTAFVDPPKLTARESLQLLEKLGISLKILTGDNELVTLKVCQELKLSVNKDQVMIGSQMETLSSEALENLVKQKVIFARLNPEQKQQIISALKKKGCVVGYLGDGINDAPSLREADIGISVNNAVDVAKEAADFILLKKSLHSLSEGVKEGRKTFGNVTKYILMGTSSNFGNMFSVAIASLFLPFLPMLPKQILLNNFLYDTSQLTLASDRVDEEYLEHPRKWNINYIKHFMLIFGPISSLFDFLTYFIMLFVFRASIPLFQTAWFTESLITQSVVIFCIRTRRVPFFKSQPSRIFMTNLIFMMLVTLALPYIMPFAKFFGLVAPPKMFYLVLVEMVVIYLFLIEIVKKWFYRHYDL